MLRSAVLGIANRKAIRRLATGGIGRRVALRFVAGETLDDAIEVVRTINARGASVSLDHLGENVTEVAQAKAAAEAYREAIDRISAERLRANISVKLTQLGLDLPGDEDVALIDGVVARAAEAASSVTLDMEDHRYTDRTLDACVRLARAYPGRIGVAIQSYLKRTPGDLARLAEADVHVRLCKGAYKEPRAIAFTKRSDVDAAYARLTNELLASPVYAMLATHDERLIRHAIKGIETLGRPRDSYEFQMLYGVRRELQQRLIQEGHPVRVYVPFGSQWYAYLMRRIAERPSNVRFFVEALARG